MESLKANALPLAAEIKTEAAAEIPAARRPDAAKRRNRSLVSESVIPVLDRCIVLLTILTAASLVLGSGFPAASDTHELLPVMVFTNTP